MSFDHFSKILEKILAESPVERPVISVYNWGEPLLHPEVGRIVRLVRRHGLYCAVSTNLNQARFLEDLVAAGPSNIKISLSGFTQDVYGRTHNKGQIEVVKTNMRRLRALIDRYAMSIDVFVGYHDYIRTLGRRRDRRDVRLLAKMGQPPRRGLGVGEVAAGEDLHARLVAPQLGNQRVAARRRQPRIEHLDDDVLGRHERGELAPRLGHVPGVPLQ
jgi:hypothetical protein